MGEKLISPILLPIALGPLASTVSRFSASRQLATLLDQLQPGLGFADQVARGAKVADLVEALPSALSQQLQGRFGVAILDELISLEKERDPELFFSGLLQLAGRLSENQETALTAQGLYHRIEVASGIPELMKRARGRRLALQGEGNFGANTEVLLRNIGKELGDYRTLLGAFAGATVASGIYKFAKYSPVAWMVAEDIAPASFEAAILRMKSRAYGMAIGCLGASIADRSLRGSLGQRLDWDLGSVARDSAAYAINLTAWRLASNFSTSYAIRALTLENPPRSFFWKGLEVFFFRQGLSVTSLGLAMLANQKLLRIGPENRTAAFAQLGTLWAGMNIGGWGGTKVLQLSH